MKKLETDFRLTTYDWKESIDLDWINSCTGAGFVRFTEVNTDGDDYGIVATKTYITEDQAQAIWDEEVGER